MVSDLLAVAQDRPDVIHAVEESGGVPFFTMECIEGKTLREIARMQQTSEETVRHEQILLEDANLYWFMSFYASYTSLDATVGAAYIEYKD